MIGFLILKLDFKNNSPKQETTKIFELVRFYLTSEFYQHQH